MKRLKNVINAESMHDGTVMANSDPAMGNSMKGMSKDALEDGYARSEETHELIPQSRNMQLGMPGGFPLY